MEWYIKGFDDPVESGLHVNSLVLTLNPDSTALNGTSVICQVTATSGEVYEETIIVMIKGSYSMDSCHYYKICMINLAS